MTTHVQERVATVSSLTSGSAAAATKTEPAKSDGDDTPTFKITQLADEFGITTRAIRFYEDKGLLHPRREGQSRIYRPRDRARLKLIVRGRRVGFTLAEIREIIDLYDLEDGGETHYRHGLRKFRERIASLQQQQHEITEQIKQLEEGCERVEGILRSRFAQGESQSATA